MIEWEDYDGTQHRAWIYEGSDFPTVTGHAGDTVSARQGERALYRQLVKVTEERDKLAAFRERPTWDEDAARDLAELSERVGADRQIQGGRLQGFAERLDETRVRVDQLEADAMERLRALEQNRWPAEGRVEEQSGRGADRPAADAGTRRTTRGLQRRRSATGRRLIPSTT